MSNSDDRQLLGKLTEAVISDPTQGPRASKAVARQVWRQRTTHWGSFFDKWSTGTTHLVRPGFFVHVKKIRTKKTFHTTDFYLRKFKTSFLVASESTAQEGEIDEGETFGIDDEEEWIAFPTENEGTVLTTYGALKRVSRVRFIKKELLTWA